MSDYDETIEDLTDLINGDVDSWDEPAVAQSAITLLKHYREGLEEIKHWFNTPRLQDGPQVAAAMREHAHKTLEGPK